MDTEKMVNSRFFAVCEWLWRLIVLNFLTLVTCCGVITILAGFSACVKSFKDYQDGSSKNVFVTYWNNLKLYIVKSLIHSAIFVALGCLVAYAIWTYVLNLEDPELASNMQSFYTVGLCICFMFSLMIVVTLQQFPLMFIYFDFRFFEQYKIGFYMSIKYILVTLAGLASWVGSVYLFLYATPVWFFIGLSLPLFIIYITSKNKYSYLSYNLNDIKDVDDLGYERVEEDETRN